MFTEIALAITYVVGAFQFAQTAVFWHNGEGRPVPAPLVITLLWPVYLAYLILTNRYKVERDSSDAE